MCGWYRETSLSPPVTLLIDRFKAVSNLWIFLVICVCLCHTVMSVSCSLVVTFWEMADLLDLLYAMFSCAFVTFKYGVLGQVWYLIVSIPVLCHLPKFDDII